MIKIRKANNERVINPSPVSREYRLLRRVALKIRPVIQASVTRGITRLRGHIDLRELLLAIQVGDLEKVRRLVPIDKIEQELFALNEIYSRGIELGGKASEKFFTSVVESLIPNIQKPEFTFDTSNPRVRNFINRQSASLVQQVSGETRKAIQQTIGFAIDSGLPPRQSAQMIADSIGLTTRQALSIGKQRSKLLFEGIPQNTVEAIIQRRVDKTIRYRSQMIARTESLRAANFGQQAVWEQALDQGIIQNKEAYKVWVVTDDEHLCCNVCQPMRGKRARISEQFILSNGDSIDQPPAHPNCRCATTIEFRIEEE